MVEVGRVWGDRVQSAVGALEGIGEPADDQRLRQMVAARYASRFDDRARLYEQQEPSWHQQVRHAADQLAAAHVIESVGGDETVWMLTAQGRGTLADADARAQADPERPLAAAYTGPTDRNPVLAGVLTPALRQMFVEGADAVPPRTRQSRWPIMIELNLRYRPGARAAMDRIEQLWKYIGGHSVPLLLADEYASGELTTGQLEGLVTADCAAGAWENRAVYRIWPDFEVHPQIDVSATTVKAQAAHRAFNSFGDGIVWAVVDSGVQAGHPHFVGYETLTHGSVKDLHRDFTIDSNDPTTALQDELGHGTHVAGVIAGGLEHWADDQPTPLVTEQRFNVAAGDYPITQPREVSDPRMLAGMAPRARLVSLKVLAGGDPTTRVTRVIRALAYVRELNASSDKLPRIHGVNLSLGYEFDPEWFACGRSPLCLEVDKLVRSGVVVVAASGNSGYVTLAPGKSMVTKFSAAMTINDPGNAARAITVGSTHRDAPHTFGISYFSSRGPTGDGRCKPDLVAPGERITSAAAGAMLQPVLNAHPEGLDGRAVYVEDSGTSMAAPHVSGAIAAFLSVQKEFIGKPEEIKKIFVDSATPLGRDPSFEGGGLLDLMRALQSV